MKPALENTTVIRSTQRVSAAPFRISALARNIAATWTAKAIANAAASPPAIDGSKGRTNEFAITHGVTTITSRSTSPSAAASLRIPVQRAAAPTPISAKSTATWRATAMRFSIRGSRRDCR